MPFDLKSILDIDDTRHFKFHAARWNGEYRPLDVFTRSREEWVGWNRWRGKRNDFNRRYIISFIDFYSERHAWLFGGIFEVIARQPVEGPSYEITACDQGADLIPALD